MTKKKEYYHITYICIRSNDPYNPKLIQDAIDKKPAEWLLECLEEYIQDEIYYLVYTEKITEEVYLKMKEIF